LLAIFFFSLIGKNLIDIKNLKEFIFYDKSLFVIS